MATRNELKMQSLPEWFAGKTIFVTGATGFMGKILVEKMLRCCPDVAAVYILIRPKRNKSPEQRIEDFVNQAIFDLLRDSPLGPKQFSKLHCVNGDVTKDNLHMSTQDRSILVDSVDMVFHMAANVKFDQPLKEALIMNTGGTLRVLDLAKSMKKLKGFVHVSTSYCHCDETILEERTYAAPHNPHALLDLASWMDNELMEHITPKLLKNAPNTYAYTKCLTEELVTEYAQFIPIAITRPSIVISAYKEPFPGWVDNLNGPTGLMVGAGKGVIRTMYCNPELNCDIVPVDMAINDILIVARELATSERSTEPMVVHLTNGKDNQVTWGYALEVAKRHFFNNPFTLCLWYPGGSITSNYLFHVVCAFFFHTIPAYFVDFLMGITGHPKFLVRTQQRISAGLKLLQYYTTRPWYFHNDKIKKLSAKLSDKDQKVFYTDINEIDWDKYMLNYILGARKYCMKEEPETIPKAKKLMVKLFVLHTIVKILLIAFAVWLVYKLLSVVGLTDSESLAAMPTV